MLTISTILCILQPDIRQLEPDILPGAGYYKRPDIRYTTKNINTKHFVKYCTLDPKVSNRLNLHLFLSILASCCPQESLRRCQVRVWRDSARDGSPHPVRETRLRRDQRTGPVLQRRRSHHRPQHTGAEGGQLCIDLMDLSIFNVLMISSDQLH